MQKERVLTESEWKQTNFPYMSLPSGITGTVRIKVWEDKIAELLNAEEVNEGLVKLMEEILDQLTEGASSHVNSPGTNLTQSTNWLSDPVSQLPRVADALASFTAAGHMAGPLLHQDRTQVKINGLMAVPKPGDHVRVVGNLKCPPGQAFNDGISDERLQDWKVSMLTAPKFAKKIVNCGREAFMACSDLKDAYKMIPVCLEQRKLQAYSFCGALFIELKLVFGDKLACQFFDKFHYTIMQAFVFPMSNFPHIAQDRTVDDVPSVVPVNAKHAIDKFVQSYRLALASLNIKAAEDDPTCTKAFDCSTSGEVLGIRFNTQTWTWSLPHEKLYKLVTSVRVIAEGKSKHSLRELEVIMGSLNYVAQMCPPLKTFISEPTFMLSSHIKELSDSEGKVSDQQRDCQRFVPPPHVSKDLLMVAAVLADSFNNPLPILDPEPSIPLCAVQIYTDASGHIAGPTSPALGILFPPFGHTHAAADSFPFPTDFLLKNNNSSLVADTTSTLESLGLVLPMMVHPDRCVGRPLEVHIDNIAVVYSFQKRRSGDKLAHTIIRAAYLLAGALACELRVSWVPRRSDVSSIIADDLTHINFTSVLELDQYATTETHVTFPPPISTWMRSPTYDTDLGHAILAWMSSSYDNLL